MGGSTSTLTLVGAGLRTTRSGVIDLDVLLVRRKVGLYQSADKISIWVISELHDQTYHGVKKKRRRRSPIQSENWEQGKQGREEWERERVRVWQRECE